MLGGKLIAGESGIPEQVDMKPNAAHNVLGSLEATRFPNVKRVTMSPEAVYNFRRGKRQA